MVKQAEGSVPSLLLALAAAIAPAVVKALISRRSRAQSEEHTMCRNHSHVAGRVFSLAQTYEFTTVRMLVTQPLTLEASNGARLTLPPYTVLFVRVDAPPASLDTELQEMVERGESVLPRDEKQSTSGHTTPPK